MSSDAFNPKLLLSSLFLTGYLACMTPGFATEAPQTPTEQEAALLLAADAEANKRFNEAWQAYRKGRIATLENLGATLEDRKSTRLNSSHRSLSRMPSSA